MRRRIGAIIHAYQEQGFHRTGTDVDRISGNWLADEVREIGLQPALEDFSLSRVDPVDASLVVNDRRMEGLPLFDGTFTSSAGIVGALGSLNSETPIAFAEIPPNRAQAGEFGGARRESRHQAIVAVTRGTRRGFLPEQRRQLSASLWASGAAGFKRGSPVPRRLRATGREGSADSAC